MNRSTEQRIASLLASGVTTSRAISEQLKREGHRGTSESSVKRYLRELRGGPVKAAPPVYAPPRPTAATDAAVDRRAELNAAADAAVDAGDAPALLAANRALYLHDHPDAARHINAGRSFVAALYESGSDLPFVLGTAESLAELAQLASDEPGFGYEPSDGETPEVFTAFLLERGKAEKQRAIDVLEDALAIVRKSDIAARWLRVSKEKEPNDDIN